MLTIGRNVTAVGTLREKPQSAIHQPTREKAAQTKAPGTMLERPVRKGKMVDPMRWDDAKKV